MVERKNGIIDSTNSQLLSIKTYSYNDLLKILLGIGIVFVASKLIVQKTLFFSDVLGISAFYISLLVIAFGTNLPELTLAIRSAIWGKRDIAMGDYMGSSAANTLMFGIFTLLNNGEVLTISNFFITFIFIIVALSFFYFLSSTKKFISRRDGLIMFGIYILFIIFEITR